MSGTIKITDVFLQDVRGPSMGAAKAEGKRIVWKALYQGISYNWWEVNDEEWARINTQPVTPEDKADLAAIYELKGMNFTSPTKPYFLHDDADWSAVEEATP